MATNKEILQQNNAEIQAIKEALANKVATSGTLDITENGKHDVAKYSYADVKVPEPNFMPYLVKYIEQEDGSYEMQITDYIEGGEGERVLIGTSDINNSNLINLYIVNMEV